MKVFRDNGVTCFFLVIALACIAGQALAGWSLEKEELLSHGEPAISLGGYIASSSFGVDLLENWQSEFLQFSAFIFGTIWLVQRGSAEAKGPGSEGRPGDEPRVTWWRRHSLLVVMAALFVLTWCGQAVTGWRQFNEEQLLHGDPTTTVGGYLTQAEFWARTLQNWQSEFLAVAAMAVFTVFLREQGSPESKRVTTPAHENEPTY
ncbi:MAG: hypothetical protein JWO69_373 [Thermoleophilia bacterium]|jgi:hypothetical protein|nr:hypothetical protein [Thermoleophilia bacterium]